MELRRAIFGIITVCCGFALLLLRKPFARIIIRSQNEAWGFGFGERSYRAALNVTILGSVATIVLGILVLLGSRR